MWKKVWKNLKVVRSRRRLRFFPKICGSLPRLDFILLERDDV